MLCMICKNNVPDEAVSCPVCGAMPWQMPESFLNPEQHQVWLDTVYTPQRERWDRMQQLQEANRTLQEENASLQKITSVLQMENDALRKENHTLQEQIRTMHNTTSELISSAGFHIHGSTLSKYIGQASEVHIPEGIQRIGDKAFCQCRKITEVTIPEGVTSIGDGAFNGCIRLRSIRIPEGVVSIGKLAFYACTGLTSVTIPGSVTSLGDRAFADCTGLRTARVPRALHFSDDCFRKAVKITRY